MRTTAKITGACALLALAVWLAWTLLGHTRPRSAPIALDRGQTENAHAPTPDLTKPTVPASDKLRESASQTESTSTTPRNPADDNTGSTEIRGRFVLPGGVPAVGVQVVLTGSHQENAGTLQLSDRSLFKKHERHSDENGRFSVRFDPPRDTEFQLDGTIAGYCTPSWSWYEIEAGTVIDVGDVVLVRGGSVRARVVDAQGRVSTLDWHLEAEGASVASGTNKRSVNVHADPERTSGEAVLTNLPPGRTHLGAVSKLAGRIHGPDVEVVAGKEVRADVVYTGPDLAASILVDAECKPFFVFAIDPRNVVLTAPGFDQRRAQQQTGTNPGFVFENVPPGAYTVAVDDPRFRPWSKSDVHPGSFVEAKLTGSAAVVLSVRDDVSGAPIDRYVLDVHFDNANFGPRTFRVHDAQHQASGSEVVEGLVPHDQTLVVRANGYAPCLVPAAGLAANESRALTARLVRGLRIEGRVVSGAQRVPVEGATVRVRMNQEGPPDSNYAFEPDGGTVDTTSDARGRFEYSGLEAGTYQLVALKGPILNTVRPLILSQDVLDLDLELPAAGRLVGHILAPGGSRFEGLRVIVVPGSRNPDGSQNDSGGFYGDSAFVPVDDAGTFRSALVPAGDVAVRLHCPVFAIPLGFGGGSTESSAGVDLGIVTLAPDVDTEHEFDLRENFPSTTSVRVLVNGTPASRVIVSITEPKHHNERGGGVTGEDGIARTSALFPGKYTVFVGSLDNAWVGMTPTDVTLPHADPIEIAIMLVEGTLTVLDATTHTPLAQAEVSFKPDADQGMMSVQATTDARGRVHLTLPVGRWRAKPGKAWGGFPPPYANFDWGTGGPSPAQVELPPK